MLSHWKDFLASEGEKLAKHYYTHKGKEEVKKVDLKRNLVYSKLFCFSEYCGIEKKYSIYQQIGISNTLMCAIYVLTAPLRRLLRIEKCITMMAKAGRR